jgi:hypothetical protein
MTAPVLSRAGEPEVAPRRCPTHLDPTKWYKTPARDRAGFAIVTCKLCGAFIGYFPANQK